MAVPGVERAANGGTSPHYRKPPAIANVNADRPDL
jgi:hypothetical protein